MERRLVPGKIEAGPFVFERSTDGTYLLCKPDRDSFTWGELLELSEKIQLIKLGIVDNNWNSVSGADGCYDGD